MALDHQTHSLAHGATKAPAPPRRHLDILARQAVFYALLCAATGASLPFLPLWLGAKGMTPAEIGWILAIPLLLRAVTGPLCGLWADRFARYRTPLLWLSVAAVIAYGLMPFVPAVGSERFYLFVLLFGVGYTAIASMTPLLDAMTLQLGRSGMFSFAWVRASGSLAFIFANICLGHLLQAAGVNAVVAWMVASACLLSLGARFLLPARARIDPSLLPRPNLPSLDRLGTLLRNARFLWLILALGCLQAAHSYYYAFSTLIWERQGLSTTVSGYLWAFGVLAELGFLSIGGPFRRWLGPWRLLILGAVAGVIRWSLMPAVSDVWLLWPLQLLHAFTFVAVYLAGLELVYLLVPPGYEGLGQSINSAYASGTMTGIATLFSGIVFERYGPQGYGFMAALAAIGLTVAMGLYLAERRPSARPPSS